jgi:hypothetical protein
LRSGGAKISILDDSVEFQISNSKQVPLVRDSKLDELIAASAALKGVSRKYRSGENHKNHKNPRPIRDA